jgi:transcriptional regulator with XRE-family HTH domain
MPPPHDEYVRRHMAAIGQRLQAAREAAGLSRTRLAHLIGTTPAMLKRIEQGIHGRTPLYRIWELALVLGVSFTEVVAAIPDEADTTARADDIP